MALGQTGYDRLARVAAIHLAAVHDGLPPIDTVAARLRVSKPLAKKLIGQARTFGFLQRAKHVPATATVFRGTARQRQWQVCGECLETWPCRLHRSSA